MSYTKQESKLCSGNNIFFFFSFLTLQYCIHFAIYQHESAKGIHMFPILNPPPSPYHPSGSSQCISPKHPVSCIEPGLATRFIYDTIHVSMPFSQIIPPSPSPTEFKRLFYTSVSLLLSHMMLLLLSRFSCVRLCVTPWTAAYQASPSMGFSRQEHWSGLPFPSPMHESGK